MDGHCIAMMLVSLVIVLHGCERKPNDTVSQIWPVHPTCKEMPHKQQHCTYKHSSLLRGEMRQALTSERDAPWV